MVAPSQDQEPLAAAGSSVQRDVSRQTWDGEEQLSELEREVLGEYALLRENLEKLSPLLADLAQNPTAGILDGLRLLERKTSLVSTLLKASVYSIVLQQEMFDGERQSQSQSEGDSQSLSEP